MKKIYRKGADLWKKETPKISQFLQTLSVAIATIPVYYSSLPEEFKSTIPTDYLKYISIAGGFCLFALQFTVKKSK
jgi:hypothetical protein